MFLINILCLSLNVIVLSLVICIRLLLRDLISIIYLVSHVHQYFQRMLERSKVLQKQHSNVIDYILIR